MNGALDGIKNLDFSTLLPGPLATQILLQSGAEVIKIERPETGDGLRHYPPKIDGLSVCFVMLNHGKESRYNQQ